MARRPKLNQQLIFKIASNVERGHSYQDSARLAGIHKSTFFKWKRQGEVAKKGIYRDFITQIEEAEVKFKDKMLKSIYDASDKEQEFSKVVRKTQRDPEGNIVGKIYEEVIKERKPKQWAAALALLERRFAQEFGRKIIEHDGQINQPQRPIIIKFGKEDEPKKKEEGMNE